MTVPSKCYGLVVAPVAMALLAGPWYWQYLLVAQGNAFLTLRRNDPIHSSESSVKTPYLNGLRACSCWNSTAPKRCCHRAVVGAHKFGIILGRKFVESLGLGAGIRQVGFSPELVPTDGGGTQRDYRHVAIVRDVYAALASGYSYHRSGHECWISPMGKVWAPDEQWHYPWYETIQNSTLLNLSHYPASRNQSICQYLVDEDEETGMAVYMAFILAGDYAGILPYLKRTQDRSLRDGVNRTLLVCLEEASDPRGQGRAFDRMVRWLYPGGGNNFRPRQVGGPGGHGTSHESSSRNRLLALTRQLDRDLFGRRAEIINSQWDCPERYR